MVRPRSAVSEPPVAGATAGLVATVAVMGGAVGAGAVGGVVVFVVVGAIVVGAIVEAGARVVDVAARAVVDVPVTETADVRRDALP